MRNCQAVLLRTLLKLLFGERCNLCLSTLLVTAAACEHGPFFFARVRLSSPRVEPGAEMVDRGDVVAVVVVVLREASYTATPVASRINLMKPDSASLDPIAHLSRFD